MLDKLIESKTSGQTDRRLGSFLLSTLTIIASVLAVGIIYSLFSYNLAMADDNLEISTLLAPITNLDQSPPKPVVEQIQPSNEKTVSDQPTRRENIQRPEESPVAAPVTTSVVPMTQQTRPNSAFTIGRDDTNPPTSNAGTNERGSGDNPGGINNPKNETISQNSEKEVEPEIKQTKKPDPPPVKPSKTLVSKGVINGEAKNLVKPAYPQVARVVGASGEVKVQVTIDEEGRVISAVAVNGHALLKPAAVSAARNSSFTPTYLSGQKVKVTGIIIYNFAR